MLRSAIVGGLVRKLVETTLLDPGSTSPIAVRIHAAQSRPWPQAQTGRNRLERLSSTTSLSLADASWKAARAEGSAEIGVLGDSGSWSSFPCLADV